MIIRPKAKTTSLNGAEISCTTEDRRVSCFLLDGDKMEKVMNQASKSDFFVVSLQLAEQIASVKTGFGSEYDDEIKSLIEEFEDITQDFKGLPPHRGKYDHKVKLTGTQRRQRRNRLSVPEFEELKKQCTDLFEQGRVRISDSRMLLLLFLYESLMDR